MRVRILLAILLAFIVLAASSAAVAESRRPPAAAPALDTAASPPAAAKAPLWLLEEAKRDLPPYPAETEAVVLLNEQTTSVNLKGVIVTSCRRAIRVLRSGGVRPAAQIVLYQGFDTKIKSMEGWVVNPSGDPRKMTMKQAMQTAMAPDTLYMDASFYMLAIPEVDTGSVVGYEWEEERTPPSLEDAFSFQESYPTLLARYTLTLPPGWQPGFNWVNWSADGNRPSSSAPSTTTFEIPNIPAIAEEPFQPNVRALAARLVVRLLPPGQDGRSFPGWPDMGTWYEHLSRIQRVPEETVSEKARSLALGAASPFARIRALTDFVQKDIRYVSIQIGIGGFQPHSAQSILANRYGDCKDKATLLAAMLKALDIESFYLIVNTDRGAVTLESPVSLYSFNHAILAIRLPDDVPDEGLDGLIRNPRLGRLLVFDPTSPITPLGRLPYYLQDNTALLVFAGGGELTRLPRPGPESNLLERKGRFTLTSDGTLSGEVEETRRGALADPFRYAMQTLTDAERLKLGEKLLASSFAAFSLTKIEIHNLTDSSRDLLIRYRFSVPYYAKVAGGLLIVRPRVVGSKAVNLAKRDKSARRYAIDLETTTLERDEFTIELPDGCAVEDLPKLTELDAGFATYRSSTEGSGRTLVYRREYRLADPILPAGRFDEALRFFLAVGANENQSALVKRGNTGRP
jgi:hypothetical protein